jgi:hypothetical protein
MSSITNTRTVTSPAAAGQRGQGRGGKVASKAMKEVQKRDA